MSPANPFGVFNACEARLTNSDDVLCRQPAFQQLDAHAHPLILEHEVGRSVPLQHRRESRANLGMAHLTWAYGSTSWIPLGNLPSCELWLTRYGVSVPTYCGCWTSRQIREALAPLLCTAKFPPFPTRRASNNHQTNAFKYYSSGLLLL